VIWGSLLLHIALKLPLIIEHWRARSGNRSQTTPGAGSPEQGIDDGAAVAGPGRWSRRAFLAAVGTTAGVVVLTTAGQSFSWLDPLNLFAPRKMGTGPQSVPVNRTAADAKVADLAGAEDWTLTVSHHDIRRALTRSELQVLPQYEHELPIACVEGWSQTARWRGVRVRDLVAAVGAPASSALRVTSLEPEGAYRTMDMPPAYAQDERTLVALELNGQTLDLDHGYPARIIAPGRPGVLQTKWLHTLEVL
jgi:DMSO/TMAO reductase YedYZ molybdopterin-dependent catalytic subunit